MHLNTQGLIIRESNTGEQNRIVTVLTSDYGILRAFVYGAKKMQSRSGSGTQLFAFSNLSIVQRKDAYIIESAEPIEVFFDLRNDIEKITLAQYFAQLEEELAPVGEKAEEYLKLILNSFSLLVKNKRKPLLVKAVFEIYILVLSGYMPNVVACENCGKFEDEVMFFETESGNIFCRDCNKNSNAILTPLGVVSAIRHVCFSESKKIFNFTLPDDALKIFSEASENYLLKTVQKKFKTLDFFHSVFM